MEVNNEKHIIIITTIETIERLSKAISFHETQSEPDLLAVNEYKRLRNNIKKQLKDLLSEIEVYPLEMV